jgi:hypothetical protein
VSTERLSHAYCPTCDVFFPIQARCPKCFTYDTLRPPITEPFTPSKSSKRWIASDDNWKARRAAT